MPVRSTHHLGLSGAAEKAGSNPAQGRGCLLGKEIEMTDDELQQKLDAQKKHCKDEKLPHFAPFNGICYQCRGQIYSTISLEKAGSGLITNCPLCCRSYCD